MTYRFGRFELNPESRQLLADAVPVSLGSRAFDLLRVLVERRGNLVTKNELLDQVWPGLVVEENNLAAQVAAIRKVIGREALATIPGLGYRFAITVESGSVKDVAKPVAAGPVQLGPLIGREAELQELKRLIAAHVLVTIAGPGGIGKTRLAAACVSGVAEVCWVDLASIHAAGRIVPAIAAAANLSLPEGVPVAVLLAALGQRDLLLVLDNCEHLAADVAMVVKAILEGARGVRILATSQAVLRVPGEHVLRLASLAVPPAGSALESARGLGAIQLFEQCAKAADARFMLTDATIAQAIELCSRLDGNPLAIQMAAARLPVLGLEGLTTHLGQRLNLLSSSTRGLPDRQKSLQATLEWSHSLLDPPERKALRQLSTFAGSFGLDTALFVLARAGIDEMAAIDALTMLVDKSLVRVEAFEPPRYRLLETMRIFAAEELHRHGERDAGRLAHGQAMAVVAEQIERSFWEVIVPRWLGLHMPAYADLQEAFDRACRQGDADIAGVIGSALNRLDFERETEVEVRNRKKLVYGMLETAAPLARAMILNCLSTFRFIAIDEIRAIDVARQRVAAWRELGDAKQQFEAMGELSKHLAGSGEFSEALELLHQAERLAEPGWPRRLHFGLATCAAQVGMYCRDEGVVRSACSRMDDRIEPGSTAGQYLRYIRARLALVTGEGNAIALLRASVEELRSLGQVRLLGYAAATLCGACVKAGDLPAARLAGKEALERSLKVEQYCQGMDHIAFLAASTGDFEGASRMLGYADAMYRESQVGRPWPELWAEEQAARAAESGLGTEAFRQLRAAGAGMTRQQANDLAQRALEQDQKAPI